MKAGMRKNRWNRALRLAGTAAAFVLLVILLSRQGWDQILEGVRAIPGWYFIAALMLMLTSRLAVAARWHALLRAAGLPIQRRDSLRITFAGLFASNFLPTTIGGDVMRLDAIAEALPRYDIVVSCTASPLPIVGLGMVERAVKARRHRPIVMVDLAVPRDIEA